MTHSASEVPPERLAAALRTAREHLLSRRQPDGFWLGHLSSSALSTATALSALALADDSADAPLIQAGLRWLAETQNADGGWGDTPDSPSNLATTLLVVSALHLCDADTAAISRAEEYLRPHDGDTPASRAEAVSRAYGEDRTFAVPILMNCALAGLVEWSQVPPLPYQLAVLPRSWYPLLRLQVVSYALPALIAVGMVIEYHRPLRSPGSLLRRAVTPSVRRKLQALQPDSGGFLEATPLTAFVCMALLKLGMGDDPVVQKGLQFLRQSAREDGSWPIDSDLSVWVTSLSLQALEASGGMDPAEAERTREWLRQRQTRQVHPFTGAAPGGWGWSYLSGAVPDGDDTPGALLALAGHLNDEARAAGVKWLLDLQNTDGGWPTFCRGWGQLPFDQSCEDLTAHALRALQTAPQDARVLAATRRGMAFLKKRQREDGSWLPLWFGNQQAPEHHNPVLGTARVLRALAELEPAGRLAARGIEYLLSAQNEDGGWGGAPGTSSSVEETALAVSALAAWPELAGDALVRGTIWLVEKVERGEWTQTTPIGLYFASLWYSEELYPVAWTVEALGRVQ